MWIQLIVFVCVSLYPAEAVTAVCEPLLCSGSARVQMGVLLFKAPFVCVCVCVLGGVCLTQNLIVC